MMPAEEFLARANGAWRTRPAAAGSAAAGPPTPAPVGGPGSRGAVRPTYSPADRPSDSDGPPVPAPPGQRAGGDATRAATPQEGTPGDSAGHGGPPLGWVPGAHALVCAPVLGELSAGRLRVLAATAAHVIVTPWRTIVVPDARPGADARLAAAGFVVDPGSAVPLVSACAGRPGCGKALADVRADARAALAAGRFTERVHLSGCARRCGSPRGPHRALVAHTEGQYTG